MHTPLTQIWSAVRRIDGKHAPPLKTLTIGNTFIDTPTDIANIIADTFAQTSSTDNYSQTFLHHKQRTEAEPLDLPIHNAHIMPPSQYTNLSRP